MKPEDQTTNETIILSSLSKLQPPQLTLLTTTITTQFHRRHRRLSALLSSPLLFSQTIQHLSSLSLSQKNLLISHHLLSSLHHLTHFFSNPPPPPPPRRQLYALRFHDYDALLLLLLLCQLHQHNPEALANAPKSKWRLILCDFYLDSILGFCDLGAGSLVMLVRFVENVARILRFVNVFYDDGGDRKTGREVAASKVAVVALPSVEVRGGGVHCVVCREEIRGGRDVCELPCRHLFHWICILPWLTKRNTCPCCRFQLPSDDLFSEIQRLWGVILSVSRENLHR